MEVEGHEEQRCTEEAVDDYIKGQYEEIVEGEQEYISPYQRVPFSHPTFRTHTHTRTQRPAEI